MTDLVADLRTIHADLAGWAAERRGEGMTDAEIRARLSILVTAAQPAREGGYSVTSKHLFTPQDIGYLLCGEFEGNFMADWINKVGALTWTRPEGFDLPWYADEAFIAAEDFSFTVNYDNPGEGDERLMKTIHRSDIIKGLELMAEKSPDHFGDLISESGADAITYDVAFQYIVLGEIVYG